MPPVVSSHKLQLLSGGGKTGGNMILIKITGADALTQGRVGLWVETDTGSRAFFVGAGTAMSQAYNETRCFSCTLEDFGAAVTLINEGNDPAKTLDLLDPS